MNNWLQEQASWRDRVDFRSQGVPTSDVRRCRAATRNPRRLSLTGCDGYLVTSQPLPLVVYFSMESIDNDGLQPELHSFNDPRQLPIRSERPADLIGLTRLIV
ncbi:hypothetical protein Q31b_19530 [Novipirellula aureliae]|uniref:Uncharacterized protein n=1 Tax=Novipirellula aureliae TaxID=2527966 RepID=A0A5C6E946_9BACT|nr:hypothetical protein [Novipirellula aureliae]TWU44417.1 hypothetical protein Q31b_19530 [Novipirellula aureliae]